MLIKRRARGCCVSISECKRIRLDAAPQCDADRVQLTSGRSRGAARGMCPPGVLRTPDSNQTPELCWQLDAVSSLGSKLLERCVLTNCS